MYDLKMDPDYYKALKKVAKDGMKLQDVYWLHKSTELCCTAIEQNPEAIKFVDNFADSISVELYASKNGMILKYLSVKSFQICLIAVKQNGLALEHVRSDIDNYIELAKTAVNQNGEAIRFVDYNIVGSQVYQLLAGSAVENTPYALQWIILQEQSEEMCLSAVSRCGSMIQYSQYTNWRICKAALKNSNGSAIQYMAQTDQAVCYALKLNPEAIRLIELDKVKEIVGAYLQEKGQKF
jgi:hypothetical protein